VSKLFQQSGSHRTFRSIDLTAPGDTRAIRLVGGNGGVTQGSRIQWTDPDGVTGIYLDSNNAYRINAVADSGTFGLKQTPASEALGLVAEAVLDTDVSEDQLFARAHVILGTQFTRVRLSNNGELISDNELTIAIGDSNLDSAQGAPQKVVINPNGMYLREYRGLGEWSDAHPLHFVAIGPMAQSPDPTVFRPLGDPLGETGDSLNIDFHVNSDLGVLIEPKPCIYAQNIDNVQARITMTDKHTVEFESALVRLGNGQVDLEALDPTWAQINGTRSPTYLRLRLDVLSGELTINNSGADRLALASHLDLYLPHDYSNGVIDTGLDLNGPRGSETSVVSGYGQRIRLRTNSGDGLASLVSSAGLSFSVENPGVSVVDGVVTLEAARAGDIDAGTYTSWRFSGADYSLRILNESQSIIGGLSPDYVLLRSPNGTLWQLSIGNDGSITTVED
jgi:hypothetical protein